MSRVSVLIAVYNACTHLRACLDSLIEQTHEDFQAICIDDASTDSSLGILQEYARRDQRFKIVEMGQNVGQARARNEGLKWADGAYTCMLDSDDWLAPDALELAVKVFADHPKADCVLFDLRYVNEDGKVEAYPYPIVESYTGNEAFRLSLDWRVHGVYMIRTYLHKEIPYDTSCRLFSDDNTTRLHYLASREVMTSKAIYYYRQHEGSSTHVVSVRHFDRLIADASMKKSLIALHVIDEDLNRFEQYRWLVIIDSYRYHYINRSTFSREESHYALRLIKNSIATLDFHRIPIRLRLKFGYIPFTRAWFLFRMEEELYFGLKKCLSRL